MTFFPSAALRKNELVGALANKPFWTRLSPWFKSAEIREIERRLAQLNDTTMVCPPCSVPWDHLTYVSVDDNVESLCAHGRA